MRAGLMHAPRMARKIRPALTRLVRAGKVAADRPDVHVPPALDRLRLPAPRQGRRRRRTARPFLRRPPAPPPPDPIRPVGGREGGANPRGFLGQRRAGRELLSAARGLLTSLPRRPPVCTAF